MPAGGAERDETGPARVLVVDDDPESARLVETFLERVDGGLDVATETRPGVGLELVRRESFDCPVSNYRMPEMDGLEFLQQARQAQPDLPGVLLTGIRHEELVDRAEAAGVGFVRKCGYAEQYERLAAEIRDRVDRRETGGPSG